ncbi:hypothetical protein [Gorillibacterium sp. sgz500922]|uniref:hypothetical protein n=1 Tax=Gorillibacterium sp. sgz500922 TaxID=3446694 RepID=UPI003F68068B
MRTKKTILFSVGVVIIALLSFTLFTRSHVSAAEKEVNKNVNAMMERIDQLKVTNPALASSSNPYDYVKDNEEFNAIVNIGPAALPVLEKLVDESKESGLREYILAIAGERIAKVDLKGDHFGWVNAKQWSSRWKTHLSDLPENFNKLVAEKKGSDEIAKLGIPVIPLILDQMEQGNTSLVPALESLLEPDQKVEFAKISPSNYAKWAKDNQSNYKELRALIEKTQ